MKTLFLLTLAAALLAGQAQADCAYPKAPARTPDASTSTLDQLLVSQKEVKAFGTAIDAYQACLETQFNETVGAQPDMTPEARQELETIFEQKMDAAAEASSSVADRLNTQFAVCSRTPRCCKGISTNICRE